jgi:hypothetical protein
MFSFWNIKVTSLDNRFPDVSRPTFFLETSETCSWTFWTLKIGTKRCIETSETKYSVVWCYVPEKRKTSTRALQKSKTSQIILFQPKFLDPSETHTEYYPKSTRGFTPGWSAQVMKMNNHLCSVPAVKKRKVKTPQTQVFVGYWKDCLELELQYSHKCSLYSVSVCVYTVGVKRLKAAVKSLACRPMGRVQAGNSERTGTD